MTCVFLLSTSLPFPQGLSWNCCMKSCTMTNRMSPQSMALCGCPNMATPECIRCWNCWDWRMSSQGKWCYFHSHSTCVHGKHNLQSNNRCHLMTQRREFGLGSRWRSAGTGSWNRRLGMFHCDIPRWRVGTRRACRCRWDQWFLSRWNYPWKNGPGGRGRGRWGSSFSMRINWNEIIWLKVQLSISNHQLFRQ